MKKIGKKFSFLTKIMLVIGLLISNLSSLSIVFADEVAFNISLVEDKLNIKYFGELADEVETVRVDVYENYTYLDMNPEVEVVNSYDLTDEELNMLVSLNENESLIVNSMLSSIVFDGTYNALIKIVDTTDSSEGVLIDEYNFNVDVLHKSGLEISVTDATTGLELSKLEDGRYVVDYSSPKIKVTANVLAGGLKPTDMFKYDDEEYTASELLLLEFNSEMDLDGHLYGDYILPVKVNLLNSEAEELDYSEELNILYGTYDMNTSIMNDALATDELSFDESYKFYGDNKDGLLYVLLNKNETNTMLDLYKIASFVFDGDEYITYLLSNSDYEDVISSYDETNTDVTLEEYLDTIKLDDTAKLSLINDGLTVTYKVMLVGDIDSDGLLNNDDLLKLIDQVVGNSEINLDKSDLTHDGVIDTLDVMYLDQAIKNENWNVELSETEATLDARLDVLADDIVSGDEFTVNYVLTLTDYAVNGVSGIIKYDETMFELISVDASNDWLGSAKNGKFLYLGSESLTGKLVTSDSLDSLEEAFEPEEYVVLAATFKALKSGNSSISIEMPEYFNQSEYLMVEEMTISADVIVNASDDNDLSSLVVAGQNIALEEDVLDYEITVSNDVTTIDVEAIVKNVAAKVTSIVYPEELVEGTNTVTVTVTSESGNEKVYTITVVREKASEENKNTVTHVNYNENDNTNQDNNTDVPVINDDDDNKDDNKTVDEEDNNLSRIIIIILILLVIAGLIYLIFKDEDDEETKKTNKDINKLKKDSLENVSKMSTTNVKKNTNKSSNNNSSSDKNKGNSNKKKER